jgi:hypothetical protein
MWDFWRFSLHLLSNKDTRLKLRHFSKEHWAATDAATFLRRLDALKMLPLTIVRKFEQLEKEAPSHGLFIELIFSWQS